MPKLSSKRTVKIDTPSATEEILTGHYDILNRVSLLFQPVIAIIVVANSICIDVGRINFLAG
jgi:hypothetical protein